MERRTFVASLVAAISFPPSIFAKTTGSIPEVVLFYFGPVASAEARAKLVRETLRAKRLVEGKDVVLSISVANNNEQLPKPAKELGDQA